METIPTPYSQEEIKKIAEEIKNKSAATTTNNVVDMDTPNPTTDEVLEQRGKRYGSFENGAVLSQTLKNTILQHYFNTHQPDPAPLDPVIAEAITMICHKLARIGNGDPMYIDNYRDISGYAELVVTYLNKGQ